MKNLIFTKNILIGHSFVALILRLILGLVFFAHGAQKVLGWYDGGGLDGTAGFMNSLGIPTALAYVSSFWEFLGGICLILGFLTRIWSAGLVINMLVAILLVHSGFFVSNGGIEFALTLLVVSVAVTLLGAGKYSVDDSIGKTEPQRSNL